MAKSVKSVQSVESNLNDATAAATIQAIEGVPFNPPTIVADGVKSVLEAMPAERRAGRLVDLLDTGFASEQDALRMVALGIVSDKDLVKATLVADAQENSNNPPSEAEIAKDEMLEYYHPQHGDLEAVTADCQATLGNLNDLANAVDGSIMSRLTICFADAAVMFLKAGKLNVNAAMQTSLHTLLLSEKVISKEQASTYASHLKGAEQRACLLAYGLKTQATFGWIAKTDCKGSRFTLTMPFENSGEDETHYRAICVPSNVITPNFFSVETREKIVIDGKTGVQSVGKTKRAKITGPNDVTNLRYINQTIVNALYYHHLRGDYLIYDMETEQRGSSFPDPTGMIVRSESDEQRDERIKREKAIANAKAVAASPPGTESAGTTPAKETREVQTPGDEKGESAQLKARLKLISDERDALATNAMTQPAFFVAVNELLSNRKVALDEETTAAMLELGTSVIHYRIVGMFDKAPPSKVLQSALVNLYDTIGLLIERERDANNQPVFRMRDSNNIPIHVLESI